MCGMVGEMNDSFSPPYHPNKWNCTVDGLLGLASSTQCNVSESHLACCVRFS